MPELHTYPKYSKYSLIDTYVRGRYIPSDDWYRHCPNSAALRSWCEPYVSENTSLEVKRNNTLRLQRTRALFLCSHFRVIDVNCPIKPYGRQPFIGANG